MITTQEQLDAAKWKAAGTEQMGNVKVAHLVARVQDSDIMGGEVLAIVREYQSTGKATWEARDAQGEYTLNGKARSKALAQRDARRALAQALAAGTETAPEPFEGGEPHQGGTVPNYTVLYAGALLARLQVLARQHPTTFDGLEVHVEMLTPESYRQEAGLQAGLAPEQEAEITVDIVGDGPVFDVEIATELGDDGAFTFLRIRASDMPTEEDA